MGTSQGPLPADGKAGGQRTVAALGYVMLFVFGALQGMIGSFQYSQSPTPLIAVLPAVGWILATFILAMSRPNGSVIITATTAGECYLYGGAAACAIGCVAGLLARVRRPLPPR